jgi:chaperone modulatory protein CbpM
MPTDELILAEELCSFYKVDFSFIDDLQQYGLIELTSIDTGIYVAQNQLQKLEQIARLHYDLNINLEGIDAIAHLLERVKNMQNEIMTLKNRLKLYEDFE